MPLKNIGTATVVSSIPMDGTVFRLGRTVERFHGDDEVRDVELDDGERLSADLVVVGLGITPATEFLRGVPVNDDGSIDVDSRLMLAENDYAVGDVARYPDPFSDDRVRIEHWRLAIGDWPSNTAERPARPWRA